MVEVARRFKGVEEVERKVWGWFGLVEGVGC